MFHLLIVEDEPLERAFAVKTVKRLFPHTLTVLESDNGSDAIGIVQNNKIDLILMDLHLGSDNGLDLSQEILEEFPAIRIIILTAYDQFTYVQQALKLGIHDFVLKPTNSDELYRSIRKQMHLLEESHLFFDQVKATRLNQEKVQTMIHSIFAEKILRDDLNLSEIQEYLGILHLDFCWGFVAVFDLGRKKTRDFSEKMIFLKEIISHFQSTESRQNIFFYQNSSQYLTVVFVNTSQPDMDTITNLQLEQVLELKKIITQRLFMELTVGISEPALEINRFYCCYKHALMALNSGNTPVNHYYDIVDDSSYSHYPKELENIIINYIFQNNILGLKEALNQFAVHVNCEKNNRQIIRASFLELAIFISREISERLGNSAQEIKLNLVEKTMPILLIDDIHEIEPYTLDILKELSNNVHEILSSKYNYIVQRAKEIIENEYKEEINLDSMASRLHISPYYLSKIFKNETGINLIAYTNNIRINAAKTLMKDPILRVSEISIMVGFNDANYFCKVFRKITGMRPSEYRGRK